MSKIDAIEIKVRATGVDFVPGFDTNRRIADLLGVPVEEAVPDYCESPDVTRPLLESRCGALRGFATVEGGSALLFDHLDALYVTVTTSPAHCLASALLCSLEDKPKM